MNCEYSEVINLEPDPELPAQWHYSKATCQIETIELIRNSETGAEFYIEKTMSYGDLLLITFISIFLIFGILKFIWNFIFSGFKGKQL